MSNKDDESIDLSDTGLDDMDFDSFDFDDFEKKSDPQIKNNREAVTELAGHAAGGVVNGVLSASRKRKIILDSLPSEYTVGFNRYQSIANEGGSILRAAREEVSKTARSMKVQVRQTMPGLRSFLPTYISDKIDNLVKDDSYKSNWVEQDPNEARLKTSTDETFGPTEAAPQGDAESPEQYTENKLRAAVKDIRDDRVNQIIAGIGKDVSEMATYNRKIGNTFKRKLLEVNFRQLFAMEDLVRIAKISHEDTNPAIQGILKNTALPDYAKEDVREVVNARFKRKLIDSFGPKDFANSFIGKFSENIQRGVKEIAGGVRDGFEMAGMMAQSELDELTGEEDFMNEKSPREQRQDQLKTGSAKTGEFLAKKYINPHIDKTTKRIRTALDKIPGIKNAGLNLENLATELPYILNGIKAENGSYDGKYKAYAKLLEPLSDMMPSFDGEKLKPNVDSIEDQDAVTPWRNKSDNTLNVIIPGMLAKIDQSIRTQTYGSEQPLETYDSKTSGFVSTTEISNRIRKTVQNKEDTAYIAEQIDKIIEEISEGADLTDVEKTAIGRHFDTLMRKGYSFDAEDAKTGADSAWMGRYVNGGDKITDALRDGNVNTAELNKKVTGHMNRARTELGYQGEEIEAMRQQYGDHALVDAGVFNKVGDELKQNNKIFDTYNQDAMDQLPDAVYDKEIKRVVNATGEASADKFDLQGIDFRKIISEGVNDGMFGKKGENNLYAALASITTSPKSKAEKDKDLEPLITEIRDLLKENNVKPTVETISGYVEEIALKGITTYTFDSKEFAEEMQSRFREMMPKLKIKDRTMASWNFASAKFGLAKSFLSPKLEAASKYISDKGNQAYDWWNSQEEYTKRRGFAHAVRNKLRGIWDISDAEGNVVFSAIKMRAGEYINEKGKAIKRITDIDGNVYNKAGEIVISKEELREKIAGLQYFVHGKWQAAADLFSDKITSVYGKAGEYGQRVLSYIVTAAKRVYRDKRASVEDIYVRGEKSPRLRAMFIKKGLYINQRTGKAIYDADDIDGPVFMGKKCIISEEEIAEPGFELCDIMGNKLKNIGERMHDGAVASLKTAYNIAKVPFNKLRNAAGAVMDFGRGVKDSLHDWIDKKRQDWGYDKAGTEAQTNRVARSARDIVKCLDKIYLLLDTRMGMTGHVNPSDQIPNKPDGKKETTESENGTDAEKKEKGYIHTKYDAAKKLAKKLVTRNPEEEVAGEKEKNKGEKKEKGYKRTEFGDADDDNIRDGSWRDRFRKFKMHRDEKKAAKKDKAKKAKSPLMSLLGMMLKPLAVLPMIASFFMGNGFTKAILGGVGSILMKGISLVASGAWGAAKLAGRGIMAIPSVATGLATAGEFLGGLATSATGVLATAATTTASAVGGYIATAATAVATVMTAPVLLATAAVATVGYFAYKASTHVVVSELNKLRYAQYGTTDYDEGGSDDVAKIRFVEHALESVVKFNKDGVANISHIGKADVTDIATGLGVKDEQSLDDYKDFRNWLVLRFAPIYLMWRTQAHKFAPGIKVDNLADAKIVPCGVQIRIAKNVHFAEDSTIWKVTRGPLEQSSIGKGWRAIKGLVGRPTGFLTTYSDVNGLEEDIYSTLAKRAAREVNNERKRESKSRRTHSDENETVAPSITKTISDKDGKTHIVGTSNSNIKYDPTISNNAENDNAKKLSGSYFAGANDDHMVRLLRDPSKLTYAASARIKTYGVGDLDYSKVVALYSLEDAIINFIDIKNGKAILKGKAPDVDKILTPLFPKVNIEVVRHWFQYRFLPVFTYWVASSKQITPMGNPLDVDLDKKGAEYLAVLRGFTTVNNVDKKPVWTVHASPWLGYTLAGDPAILKSDISGLDEANKKKIKDKKSVVLGATSAETMHKMQEMQARNEKLRKKHKAVKPKPPTEKADPKTKNIHKGYNWTAEDAKNDPFFDQVVNRASQQVDPGHGPEFMNGFSDFRDASTDANSAYGKIRLASPERSDVAKMISEVSKITGVDENIMLTIAMMESNLKPNAKAKSSSASGLFQFIRSTWREKLGKYGKKYGIPRNATAMDPVANALIGAEFLREGSDALKPVLHGRAPSPVDLYMSHFMGPGGARSFMRAMNKDPQQNAAKLFPKPAKANEAIFYNGRTPRTLAQVYNLFSKKIQKRTKQIAQYASNPLDVVDRVNALKKEHTSIISDNPAINDDTKDVAIKAKGIQDASSMPTNGGIDSPAVATVADTGKKPTATPETKSGPSAPTSAPAGEEPYSKPSADTKDKVVEKERTAADVESTRSQAMESAANTHAENANNLTKELGKVNIAQLEVQQKILEVLNTISSKLGGPANDANRNTGNRPTTKARNTAGSYSALLNMGRR